MATAFFLMRLNDHVQYLKKIEATLAGTGDFQGTEHHECKLGKWLYGDGVNEVLDIDNPKAKEVFDSLLEPHAHFHQASKIALSNKEAGDEEGVKKSVTEMYKISQDLTQKMLELDGISMR